MNNTQIEKDVRKVITECIDDWDIDFTKISLAIAKYIQENYVSADTVFYPIKGYEGLYEINKLGEVRSIFNNYRVLKPYKGKYMSYTLKDKNGNSKHCFMHRLLGETFLDGKKDVVNHKDGNKLNNSLSNLEWATYKEDKQHAWATGLNKPNIKHRVGNEMAIETAKENGISRVTFYYRIWHGWDVTKAATEKPRKWISKKLSKTQEEGGKQE